MLEAWIIEQLKQREEDARRRSEDQPCVESPIPPQSPPPGTNYQNPMSPPFCPQDPGSRDADEFGGERRGVVIIPLL